MGKRRATESIVEVIPLLEPQHAAAVDAAIAAHRDEPGALLPMLHAIQSALGFIPEGVVPPVARALALTRADVHGVISFYHDFRRTPPGRNVLKLCQAEACQAVGAREVFAHACSHLGTGSEGGSTADGRFTLEPAYCLGNCALGPAMLVADKLHGRVTPNRFDAIVAACSEDVEHTA